MNLSLDNTVPQCLQYTTKSYEPSSKHVASTIFSLTFEASSCPIGAMINES